MAALLRSRRALALALLAAAASARSAYRAELPNGFAPASTSYGHYDGGSNSQATLNSFGSDFNAAGIKWTRSLCTRDSDGDGQSNGFELGDPCCVWAGSGSPAFTTQVGDPGHAGVKSSRNCSAVTCANGVSPCAPTGAGAARVGAALSAGAALALAVGAAWLVRL